MHKKTKDNNPDQKTRGTAQSNHISVNGKKEKINSKYLIFGKVISCKPRIPRGSTFMTKTKSPKLTVILREEAEGGYSVQVAELSGCISQGENQSEALANIREAIKGYTEAFPEEIDKLKTSEKDASIKV